MQRQLVSIQHIDDIIPHSNADNLEIALIKGWRCIVPKGQFSPGESVVYFEIDSLLPISEKFEYLRKYSYVNKSWMLQETGMSEGFRIKTLKLRGEISQGLVVKAPHDVELTTNLEEYFGVKKYEPPIPVKTNNHGSSSFPCFLVKTGETRIQNKLHEVMADRERLYEVTRKYHGSSFTVYAKLKTEFSFLERIKIRFCELFNVNYKPIYKYGVCSHNVERSLETKDCIFVGFALNYGVLDQLKAYIEKNIEKTPEIAIQGELCAPYLQKNHHGLTHEILYVFNIFDITNQRYLLPKERWERYEEIFGEEHNSKYVKHATVEYVTKIAGRSLDTILDMSDFMLSSGKPNEGLVWKAMDTDFSFKVINNNYLLMED